MSPTCAMFSDKVNCFSQSERALYGDIVIKEFDLIANTDFFAST